MSKTEFSALYAETMDAAIGCRRAAIAIKVKWLEFVTADLGLSETSNALLLGLAEHNAKIERVEIELHLLALDLEGIKNLSSEEARHTVIKPRMERLCEAMQ